MFVREKREPVTIWVRWINQVTGEVVPIRRVLPECVVQNSAEAIRFRTGAIGTQSLDIMAFTHSQDGKEIPYRYVSYSNWLDMPLDELDGFWSLSTQSGSATLLHVGESLVELPSGSNAQVTQAENNLLQQTIGGQPNPNWLDNTNRVSRIVDSYLKASPKASYVFIVRAL